MQKAYFAAGCFWGVESAFRQVEGVRSTAVGYMGGKTEQPTYEDVCTDTTGHAETLEVEFDPAQVSYDRLLDVFWDVHDPTTLNRQGPDFGTQYRSAIFCTDAGQDAAARASKGKIEHSRRFARPVVTEIAPARTFWRAEEYHQQYFDKRGRRAHLPH
ncbi:MAG: peptide-methionine (S)-S-oxide reductase MsrA [Candidatus Lambdaproteobacteria bacterium]|nr:peptide-methionine (S)-S-oxide reductase MsrA [Candidatus Lambdaproteobacteria bacterium]